LPGDRRPAFGGDRLQAGRLRARDAAPHQVQRAQPSRRQRNGAARRLITHRQREDILQMLDIAPTKQAALWLEEFAAALEKRDIAAASRCFLDDCYWRDLLTFTWTIRTMEGREAIAAMLEATLSDAAPSRWRISGEASTDGDTVEAWFAFETAVARGEGIFRLVKGRCRTLFTAMRELKGFE